MHINTGIYIIHDKIHENNYVDLIINNFIQRLNVFIVLKTLHGLLTNLFTF